MTSILHPAVAPTSTFAGAPPWADLHLEVWLKTKFSSSSLALTIVHSEFQCAFFADDDPATLERGDPEKLSFAVLRKFSSAGRLKKLEVTSVEFQAAKVTAADWAARSTPASWDQIKAWKESRARALGQGRGRPLSTADELRVWREAGARCMYRGCARDVGSTSLTVRSAPSAYLAHIVASDENGPRGDATSLALSDDPDNIMLMCDEHHRLIDRIDVEGHLAPRLNAMRLEHVNAVRNALDALAFPRSKAMAVLGDVANLATSAYERDMRRAVLQRRLACDSRVDYVLRRTQRDDRSQPGFWQTLLHQHEHEILELRRLLQSNQPFGDSCEVLSLFALLPTPLLVLVGRIVGEARRVELYQYDAARSSWTWDENAVPKAPGTFTVELPSVQAAGEVLLTIELTAELDITTLPPSIAEGISNGSISWVRVRNSNPSNACIATGGDLDQFKDVAREAVRFVQDNLRASHVHLIGISPASTMVAFGQLLRPGHHSMYTVYDRPNSSMPWGPAMVLTGTQVTSAGGVQGSTEKTIMLR